MEENYLEQDSEILERDPGNFERDPEILSIKEPANTESTEKPSDDLMGYDHQIEALESAAAAVKPETEEERKKRERKEKSKKIISAIGDGISALSNLYFTSQYAPNSFNPRNSSLTKLTQVLERQKAERKADADRYNNIMLRLGDVRNAKAKTLREIQAQQEAQKIARQKAENEAKRFAWEEALQPDKQLEQRAKAEKAGYDAENSRYESENKPHELELKNNYIKAGIRQRDASAYASKASAVNSYASAAAHNRSNQNEFVGNGADGRKEHFRNRQAAIDFERAEKTYDPARWGDDVQNKTETTEDLNGVKTTTRTKKYPSAFNLEDYKRTTNTTQPPLN